MYAHNTTVHLCVAHVSLSFCCSISCEEDTFIPPDSEKLEFESENETQNTEKKSLTPCFAPVAQNDDNDDHQQYKNKQKTNDNSSDTTSGTSSLC